MHDIDLILIDYDGVVSRNSVHIMLNAMYDYINKYAPMPYEAFENLFKSSISFSFNKTMYHLCSSLGIEDKIQEMGMMLMGMDSYNNEEMLIEGDFIDLVDYCNQKEIKYKIFSSADKKNKRFDKLLEKIGDENIYPSNDRSKADIKTFREVAEDLKIDLNKCLYLEDAPLSLRTGKLLGMKTFMMLNNVFTEADKEVYRSYIDYSVKSFSEFINILDEKFI